MYMIDVNGSILYMSVVPNLFGIRDQFCGRQFFHGPGAGGGMVWG